MAKIYCPIYIDGAEYGVLTAEKNGLYTCITADCKMTDKLVRLSVYGEGDAAYLGTLYPKGGRLHLVKRFSPSEMRRFPKNIRYAANSEIKKCEEESCTADDELLWFQTENGSLTAFDGEKSLVAIPASGDFRGCRTMKIGGRDYMIFVSKRNLQ